MRPVEGPRCFWHLKVFYLITHSKGEKPGVPSSFSPFNSDASSKVLVWVTVRAQIAALSWEQQGLLKPQGYFWCKNQRLVKTPRGEIYLQNFYLPSKTLQDVSLRFFSVPPEQVRQKVSLHLQAWMVLEQPHIALCKTLATKRDENAYTSFWSDNSREAVIGTSLCIHCTFTRNVQSGDMNFPWGQSR